MKPIIRNATKRNVQESLAPNGDLVSQEVLRHDYVALTRGPLAYATRLVDGYRTSETLRAEPLPQNVAELQPENGLPGSDLELRTDGRAPLRFEPYYRAGGRGDGAWRLTWLAVAPLEGRAP
jgi:hypothetical protein